MYVLKLLFLPFSDFQPAMLNHASLSAMPQIFLFFLLFVCCQIRFQIRFCETLNFSNIICVISSSNAIRFTPDSVTSSDQEDTLHLLTIVPHDGVSGFLQASYILTLPVVSVQIRFKYFRKSY